MSVERKLTRKFSEIGGSPTFLDGVFECPVVRQGCAHSMPPWCILHREVLSKIVVCSHQTYQSLTCYDLRLKLLNYEELLEEVKSIGLEIETFVGMASCEGELLRYWNHHCGGINVLEGEAKERWNVIPLELRLAIEMVKEKETVMEKAITTNRLKLEMLSMTAKLENMELFLVSKATISIMSLFLKKRLNKD
jgi:hypothetical protein